MAVLKYVCSYVYSVSMLPSLAVVSHVYDDTYGVATIGRLLKMTSLFCQRALEKSRYSAKETYNLKEPANRSHPICECVCIYILLMRSLRYQLFHISVFKYVRLHSYSVNILPSLAVVSNICDQICVCVYIYILLMYSLR